MEGYLLASVKRTLVSELQAKGYAPHISDVHQAAVSVIAAVEADLKARLLAEGNSQATVAATQLDEVEVEASNADYAPGQAPVVPQTPSVVPQQIQEN